MTLDLLPLLPVLLPKAIAWADAQAAEIEAAGAKLSPEGLVIAQRVGVSQPERIRVAFVDHLPIPEDPMLRQAAFATRMLGPDMIGLTLGHGIYLCRGRESLSLLAHECRHVYQYESAGSIAAFLPEYLRQIVTYGYDEAPLEKDARAFGHCHL